MIARLRGARAALVLGVALVGAAPMALVPSAQAATCTGSGGVSVVVDNRELGGGIETGCVPDGGGKSATAIFAAAGVQLTYATRQPGFVCRVGGIPASDPCVNASPSDAYWGLWWANGSSAWTYSTSGVGALTVPDGGSVAWSWQQDRAAGQAVPPGVPAPVTRSASPSPTPTPTPTATSTGPASGSTGGSAGASTGGSTGGSSGPGAGSGAGSATAPSGGSGTAPGGGASGIGSASGSGSDRPTSSPSGSPSANATASAGRGAAEQPGKDKGAASPQADPSRAGGATDAASRPSGPATSDIDPGAKQAATADQPEGIPVWLTWTVFGAVLLVLVTGALISRRRARA